MLQSLTSILDNQGIDIPNIILREPRYDQYDRWVNHSIMGQDYVFSQPITFTPYASVKPCSARCKFCSENLRSLFSKQNTSLLRPDSDYFNTLEKALSELQGLPLSYSLSGLEMTDDAAWFSELLTMLSQHRNVSPIESSILYSNTAGLVGDNNQLIDQIAKFNFDWIEVSRHHFDEPVNQRIMRFRQDQNISSNIVFSQVIETLLTKVDVKLVCIIQSGGVDSPESAIKYLQWANALGVKHVIFREFSSLNQSYKNNNTYRYIESSRKSMTQLLEQLFQYSNFKANIDWLSSTSGYYFNNLIGTYKGMSVTFEHSDYAVMNFKHASDKIYKLVFHANGNLCAGWAPDEHILFSNVKGGIE